MTSTQYEELCRRHIAEAFRIPLDRVQSKHIPNPQRPGGAKFQHQIDLWWETGNASAQYVHIANAKWRGSDKVDQDEVELLEYVRNAVGAHKAVMLTPIAFTEGAYGVADHHGIALHVVEPVFDTAALPTGGTSVDRAVVAAALEAAASASQGVPLYKVQVVHRGLNPQSATVALPADAPVHKVSSAATSRPAPFMATVLVAVLFFAP